ncbi:MAG TPA: MarR family winged helix-turn-helix transcriptional regulator [Rhizomicrobium sp.]|nr:MarR family winged helix-turn-helix transcriptional regulator [Rhizomicrobium sp.]
MSKPESISLKQTHHIRDSCICLHVQRAARVIARRFDDALRPFGLTNGQFSLIVSLNRPQPAGMSAVASLLAVDRTTLTANLKPLERRGLLKISSDRRDRRNRTITLTAKGRALLKSAYPIWEATHAAQEALLKTPDQLRSGLLALS